METTTGEAKLEQQSSVVFDLLASAVLKVEKLEKVLEPILTEDEPRKGENAGEEGRTKLIKALLEVNDKLESVLERIVL